MRKAVFGLLGWKKRSSGLPIPWKKIFSQSESSTINFNGEDAGRTETELGPGCGYSELLYLSTK